MKKYVIHYLIVIILISGSCTNSRKEIKIACVGNSITEGYGIRWQSKSSYPVMLDSILGAGYAVMNLGRSATTLSKKGDFPYWTCKEFYDVFVFNPDIIIIKLGTNDTKSQNWNAKNFVSDYQALIDTFRTIPARPKIYICLPVLVYKDVWGITDSVVRTGVIPAIKSIAKVNNLPVIDLYTQMSNQSENFPDGVHPNEKGAKYMAEIIAKAIKNEK